MASPFTTPEPVTQEDSLVTVYNNQPVVSSRDIAVRFEKEHKNVLRDIDGLVQQMASEQESSKLSSLFFKTEYTVEGQTRKYPEYLMTYDGFSLLVMGFTGKKALQWKLKYIDAFNRMAQKLQELSLPSYQIEDPVARARKWADEMEAKNKKSWFSVMKRDD